MSDYYKELVTEFTKPEPIGQHLLTTLETGFREGSIIPPLDMTIDGVDYGDDWEAYIIKRLPELYTETGLFMPIEVNVNGEDYARKVGESIKSIFSGDPGPPALTTEEWSKLGAPNGDPKELMQPGSKLQTGKLLQYIFGGDKSILFPKT